MRFSAYVICATPRSGSTLLCDLLTASRVAGQPQSYFRSQGVDHWAGEWGVGGRNTATDPEFNLTYLSAMKRAGSAGTGIVGLRLMWPSLSEAADRLHSALGGENDFATNIERAFGPTLFIHLSRRDKLAQAVSLVRAEQTGLWHIAADGSERQRVKPPQPAMFDAGEIRRARELLEVEDGEWLRFFAERTLQPLRLTYENLSDDPRAILAETLEALGCDPAHAEGVTAQTGKMADATDAHWADLMMG